MLINSLNLNICSATGNHQIFNFLSYSSVTCSYFEKLQQL